jgi:hypothetical protein
MCKRCDLGSVERYCPVCVRIKLFEFLAREDGLYDILHKIIVKHPEILEEIYAEYDFSTDNK